MNNKNKSKKTVNPEIQRENEERRKARTLYDDDDWFGLTLYPGAFLGSTASATESTGLIQVMPTPDMMDVYDDVYSYRQTEAIRDKSEFTD